MRIIFNQVKSKNLAQVSGIQIADELKLLSFIIDDCLSVSKHIKSTVKPRILSVSEFYPIFNIAFPETGLLQTRAWSVISGLCSTDIILWHERVGWFEYY